MKERNLSVSNLVRRGADALRASLYLGAKARGHGI
jgi:hypothetical protein